MAVRANRNLTARERLAYTYENFRGVDFSTSPYKVAPHRATQAKNLIYRDGTTRKRNGWKSVCNLDGKINGLFTFEIEDEKVILCYCGTAFYRLTKSNVLDRLEATSVMNTCTYPNAELKPERLTQNRIQLYVNNNKAYIIGCGDYLVFGKWGGDFELRRVYNNEDTFIPLTTINIDEDSIPDEARGSLDGVNILSPYRKNDFVGVDASTGTWTVDTAIPGLQAINEGSYVQLEIRTYDIDGVTPITLYANNRLTGTDRGNLFLIGDDATVVGTIDWNAGKITLLINTKPLVQGQSNITITFEHSVPGQEDIIANGTLSTIFGGGGVSNRLFIGGNAAIRHIHYWSEIYNFTYFSDTNYAKLGSDSSSILGYVRVNDGTLLVFKERNGSDSTAYYITGADVTEEDILGNPEFVTQFFAMAGNVSDTIYAKDANANLNGDNLILTRNGVKGLQFFENVATDSYNIQNRGRAINEKLIRQEGLQDACGFVFMDKYYLSVDGVCYIADGKFTYEMEEDVAGSFNYEWWYWTNFDARVFCEIDNELYFGTSDGLICKMYEGYADTLFQDTESGDLTISTARNAIVYNVDLDRALSEDDNIIFTQGDVYSLFLNTSQMLEVDSEGFIHVDEETVKWIFDGITVFADNVSGTGLELDVEYEIGVVDLDNLRFPLFKGDEQVFPTAATFRLCRKISNKSLFVTNIDYVANEFQVKLHEGSDPLELINYNFTTPVELLATIIYKQNILAEWFTPIFDLGTNMLAKTLLNVAIATEPLVKGSLTVGYQTRNLSQEFFARGQREFDFNDIDFYDFSFGGSFASSFTLRAKERNFNFIVVRYVSDNQHACAVNSITIRYKINNINKGVR